ncbi:MAG TPA: ABC transporter permease, partial [Blastocatellia bacterium]|nr:ABC transporter permease [Blastocatellia bacterium]
IFGVRMLGKSPGFTLAAVLSLALGIGANTAIFTLVNAVLLKPLPVEDPSRLVSVFGTDEKNRGQFQNFMPISQPNFKDYRDQNSVFAGLFAHQQIGLALTTNSEPQQVAAEIVSGNYFDVLGIKARFGRIFTPEEDTTPGAHPVVMLSHALWQTRFGADRALIGNTVKLNNQSFTVVGIAPENFRGTNLLAPADLWVPMMMHEQVLTGVFREYFNDRRALLMNVTGRLKPGVTIEQAESAMKSIASALEQQYPRENEKRSVILVPLPVSAINPNLREAFVKSGALLISVVAVVLLIACANVANLLLVRATARRREIAIRLALGAGRGRLLRQLLTESLLLALLGGGLGLLFAIWGRTLLWSFRPPFLADTNIDISLNAEVLGFTLLLSLLTGAVFGLAPALRASRSELVSELKDKTNQATHEHRWFSLRNALVVAQVTLSLVALIGAGLFVRSLRNAQQINPGFETEKLMMLSFSVGALGYNEAQGQEFYRRVQERVESVPGVQMAAVSSNGVFNGGFQRSVTPEGETLPQGSRGVLVMTNNVGLKYFETLGIPLLNGRLFSDADREGVTRVAIINEAAVKRFWPEQNAVGKRFRFFGEEFYREVVGIVPTTVIGNLGEDPQPQFYAPMQQNYADFVTLYVRTEADPTGALNTVRREVQALAPTMLLTNAQTMSEILRLGLWAPRMGAVLLGIFGLLALLLAAVGLYGVLAYTVSQRTQEIGIRMALGAPRANILRMVLQQGMTLVLAGVGLGVIVGLFVTRMLTSLLFAVSAVDPLAFIAMPLLLLFVALFACWIPALRATKVDPMIALRYE